MEKLSMCRICLVENVRMYVVVNKNLHELYEKLTDIPFVTGDSRPMLACFICCTKLKQCCQLLRKCLEAEELFAQMMNEDYEPNSVVKQDRLEFFNRFTKSLTENINIVDVGQIETIGIKEEALNIYETPDDIIKPKEKPQNNELGVENLKNSYLEIEDIPPHHSESDLEYYVPLLEFKTEAEEEQEVSKKEGRARETDRAPVAKKPKIEDKITTKENKNEIIKDTQNHTSKADTKFKDPTNNTMERGVNNSLNNTAIDTNFCNNSNENDLRYNTAKIQAIESEDVNRDALSNKEDLKCEVCRHSFTRRGDLNRHIRAHSGENPYKCEICRRSYRYKDSLKRHVLVHTGEEPHKCDICQRSFKYKNTLISHARIHTGEKPYKCEMCPRGFGYSSDLKKHIRIHTGEKPYKCDICQRCFNQSNNLKRHVLQHTS